MNNWKFDDPKNVAVFTSESILNREAWIYYVSHDEDDGAWQFHPPGESTPVEEAKLMALEEIVNLDPTIEELYDLPYGWYAWRESPSSPWKRMKKV